MELLIIFILVLLNGIFSMSEIALVSSKKFKLESSARKGSSNAKKALELSENPDTFLSTVQIGITLIGILTGIYSGDKITADVKVYVEKINALAPYADTISVVLMLVLLTFFSIVLGELIPKRIGLMFPEKIAMLVARPMTIISIITKPFIWLLTKTNNLVLDLFNLKEKGDGTVSEEEIKAIVQESAESGEIDEIEQNIVERVFALGDRKVSELMTHRGDLVWMDIEDDYETVKQKAAQEIHSVYVVANEDLDHLEGVISVKTLFPKHLTNENFKIKEHLEKPIMVHENTPAYQVLEMFKRARFHYAVVIDEYGLLQGLVAMDDVVDALLGDSTEYNQTEYQITQRAENSWLADAQIPYFVFAEHFNLPGSDRNYNTLSGLILHLLHHIPTTGEKVRWKDFEFEIADMDGSRIDKIIIRHLA
jgi:putative hemolysin